MPTSARSSIDKSSNSSALATLNGRTYLVRMAGPLSAKRGRVMPPRRSVLDPDPEGPELSVLLRERNSLLIEALERVRQRVVRLTWRRLGSTLVFQDVFLWGLDYALEPMGQSPEQPGSASSTLPLSVELRQDPKARHFCGSSVRFLLVPEDRVRVDGTSVVVAFTREQGALTIAPVTVPRNDVLKPVYSRDAFDADLEDARSLRRADKAAMTRSIEK